MKKYITIIMSVAILSLLFENILAQQKKVSRSTSVKTIPGKPVSKFTPRDFSSPSSVSDITDVKQTDPAYESIKNLVETNAVTLVYADSTFRPREPLRRGDFMVSFNAALDAIKKTADAGGADSALISADSKNQSPVTSVSEIKDLKESSVYYPAVKSLIEKWGIASPFKTKTLNAGATMPEGEVYDILKATLGYNSSAINPYASAMSRSKFAMVLNNALSLKLSQVNEMISSGKDSADDVRRQQQAMLKQADKLRKDSIAKSVELSNIDAQKKQAENWNKLSESQKRKQLKSQNAK